MSLRVLRSRVVSFLKQPFWINSRFCHYRRPSPPSTPAAVCNFIRGDLSKTARRLRRRASAAAAAAARKVGNLGEIASEEGEN